MKYIPIQSTVILAFLILSASKVNAQVTLDSSMIKKEYSNLEEALKEPENVFRLNLSNQNFKMPSDSIWMKFINLEYLSLKNDHLKVIPLGLGNLKKLSVLDLSGNDFQVLPPSFSNLENLTELFLNDEKKIDFNTSLMIISKLPNLRILHLENDNLKSMPQSLLSFSHLEKLYLNNNKFKQTPLEVVGLKNLKYLDLHDNKFRLINPNMPQQGLGMKINF
nr:leucine-rich repeat domain-containing protein [Bacteroidota bacterium]